MTIPSLPDTERLTEYTIAVADDGPFSVDFDIYADDDDPENWIEVWLDGEQQIGNWTLTSLAGGADLSIIARPITDARITFDSAITGELVIVGARRPRQASQFINGVSISADQHNRRYTDLMSISREAWDWRSRVLRAPPGEDIDVMPPAADRASKFLGFSTGGHPVAADALETGVPAIASAIDNDSDVPGDNVAEALNAIGDQFVDARADIASITPPASVDTIITGGFATAGDGGHGVLVRHGASDPGLPSGFQIQDASGVYWKRATNTLIFAKEVGITADGSTDDYQSIQDALDYIADEGGGTLVLPAGDIVCTGGDPTISSSNTEMVGQGWSTLITLGATRKLFMHHASVEVNRSAFRRLRITHSSGTTSSIGIRLVNCRRCQLTDLFFHSWSGDCIVLGDGGVDVPNGIDIFRIRALGGANARHGFRFTGDDPCGDMNFSHIMMDPGSAAGVANQGNGIRIEGASGGSIDGLIVTDSLFSAFSSGLHAEIPTGYSLGNIAFANITFDCGVEQTVGANNLDNILFAVSGGSINGLSFNHCIFNAYHTSGTSVPFHFDMTGGSVAQFYIASCKFYNSYVEGAIFEQSGGTVAGISLVGNNFGDGSRASAGGSSALFMSGDIDKIMIADNTILHGSGNNWEYGFDLSGLTGDVPYIGPNQIQNVATGTVNLSGTHATAVSGKFWNGKGELETGGGEDLVSTGSSFVQIDSDNNTTNAEFQVRKDSATPGAGTLIFSVDEAGLVTTLGQIKFPATQNASADANTLDDYEEGTWTPVGTFSTPGDLSIAYSSQAGMYTKIGRAVTVHCILTTSTFTHTTAAGTFRITGLPFTANAFSSQAQRAAGVQWAGITKAGYTDLMAKVQFSDTYLEFTASGSGVANSDVGTADMPTGGTVNMRFGATYFT